MDIVQEVNDDNGQLEYKVNVVAHGSLVLPLLHVVLVPQVNHVFSYDIDGSYCQCKRLNMAIKSID